MNTSTILTGAVCGVVGLLVGLVATPSGPDMDDISAAIASASQKTSGDIGGQLSAHGDKLADLEAALASLVSGTDAKADKEDVAGLGSRFDALEERLGAAVSDGTSSQVAALEAGLAKLQDELTSVVAAAPAPAPAVAATTDTSDGPPTGVTPGHTVSSDDGAVRVFVSRVDDSGARLFVNGTETAMAPGDQLTQEGCTIQLGGVDRGHATVSVLCGTDLPAPEGMAPGKTALFGDGAVRVFLSSVADDAKTARIAVNGFTLQTVENGEVIELGDGCKLHVAGLDRGHANIAHNCD